MGRNKIIMNTKQKLVKSALKLFNQKWFESTSTTSICTDAGFSSWALFVHFKTKNDLLDFLYVDIKKKYFSYVFSKVDIDLDIEAKFREILKISFEFYLKNYDEYMFLKRFSSSVHISRIAQEEVEKEMEEFSNLYHEGVKQWIYIQSDYKLVLTTHAAMFYAWVEFVKHNWKQHIDEIISMILKTIKK